MGFGLLVIVKQKSAFEHVQNARIHIILVHVYSHPGICPGLKLSIVSNDSVCGQRRP